MPETSVVSLVHAAGFLTGIALYAMLGWMTFRDVRATAAGAGPDRITFASAVLGLLWNVGALLYFGAADLGATRVSPLVGVVAFSALGFLPAAVVHSAVQVGTPLRRRLIVGAAYAVSTASMILQASSAGDGWSPNRNALLLLTIGYVSILVVLTTQTRGGRKGGGTLAAVGLAVFAVMALHLSQHRDGPDSVIAELIGHQGSLPLVLVILYQDYRFAFADLFLKRALSLLSIVTLALTCYLQLVAPLVERSAVNSLGDSRTVGIVIVFAVSMAVIYPFLQRAVSLVVDRVILRRADYDAVRQQLMTEMDSARSESEALDRVCRILSPSLSADRVTHQHIEGNTRGSARPTWPDVGHSTVAVAVPVTDLPAFRITVGALVGGRRLLSDDIQLIESAALLAARRIDGLRVERERFERAAAEIDVRRLVSEAELRALRAQLNPHFLFNSLTTIGHLLTEAPDRALTTLLRLTELLRAVLKPAATDLVTVADEMEIVLAYLEIEQARFEERLQFTIDLPAEIRTHRIPPLLIQPIVENAVKHGIAPLRRGGRVHIAVRVEHADSAPTTVCITVSDTGAGAAPAVLRAGRAVGVGLNNVEQRIAHQFGSEGGLTVESADGEGTTVRMWMRSA